MKSITIDYPFISHEIIKWVCCLLSTQYHSEKYDKSCLKCLQENILLVINFNDQKLLIVIVTNLDNLKN